MYKKQFQFILPILMVIFISFFSSNASSQNCSAMISGYTRTDIRNKYKNDANWSKVVWISKTTDYKVKPKDAYKNNNTIKSYCTTINTFGKAKYDLYQIQYCLNGPTGSCNGCPNDLPSGDQVDN